MYVRGDSLIVPVRAASVTAMRSASRVQCRDTRSAVDLRRRRGGGPSPRRVRRVAQAAEDASVSREYLALSPVKLMVVVALTVAALYLGVVVLGCTEAHCGFAEDTVPTGGP